MELSSLVARLTAADGDDDWVRPRPTRHQLRLDVALGAVMAAAGAGSAVLAHSTGMSVGETRPALQESLAWCAAVALPLTLRRRFPLAVMIAVAALFIGLQVRQVPEAQMSAICLFLALFTAGAWSPDRHTGRVVRVAVIVVMFAWLAYALSATAWAEHDYGETSTGPIPPITAGVIYVTLLNVLYFAAATGFGTMAWNRARQAALLVQRNAELAIERDANAQRAVVAERLRIARELHDVVAHHVSLMGIQAAAARRVLDADPALSRSTLEGVEESGRIAVDEMHRLLGVLRSENETDDETGTEGGTEGAASARNPAPGVADVGQLVTRANAAGTGLRADLTVVGEPVEIPASVSVSAYRIVQEALTNTLRHAAAQRVDVRLRYLSNALEVEVVDDGHGGQARPGTGLGHVGMRERVLVHGGELEVGPRAGGDQVGYRVRARLPLPVRSTVAP